VGTTKSLTHDGGGDTQAVVQMVKYALTKYDGDPKRVYAMGGSSGAMMTQALMAVYPDVFRAGSARAGVAAGCWADGYASSNQWSNNCAGGNTTKSAQAWGDQARAMFAGYTGHRPRVQLFHGQQDTTINYKNMAESIKQWTNVLGLPTAPSSTDMKMTSVTTYTRQYWQNECGYNVFEAWAGPGTHSMAYEEADILAFFGLDTKGGVDPEPDCPDGGGSGGMGGMGGASVGGAGAGGTSIGGVGPIAGAGGGLAFGGSGGGGETVGAGGFTMFGGGRGAAGGGMPSTTGGRASGTVGGTGAGGAPGAAGNMGTTGGTGASSTSGSAGRASGGVSSAGTTAMGDAGGGGKPDDAGCGVAVGGSKSTPAHALSVALGLTLLGWRRRRRGV
jgi:poly(hydroxyalkanoate) depolymerase family esterase